HAALEVLRGGLEIAAAELDDAGVVVSGDEVPEIALLLGELQVHLEIRQRRVPVAELPERVAEVRRRHLAELLGAELLATLQRLEEKVARLLPTAEVVLDAAEHVLDVAVDDVGLDAFQQLEGALGKL